MGKRRKDDSTIRNSNAETEIILQEQATLLPAESSTSVGKTLSSDKDSCAANLIETQAGGHRIASGHEDAPAGHVAHERCQITEQTNASGLRNDYCRFSLKGLRFQVTVAQAGGNV